MNIRRFFGALRRHRRDLSDVLAERIAHDPTPGVPYLYVDVRGGMHDLYPHMSQRAREVCIGYLEQMWALPARERAS